MRYPATIAGIIGLVLVAAAAALFLSETSEGAQRFTTLLGMIGLAVAALANNLRTDHAATDSHETKEAVNQAIADGMPRSDASLAALTAILERIEQAAMKAEVAATAVTNGNGGEHP